MQAGASQCLTVPRYHDRDAKRLELEPILFERGKKMPDDADITEMCTQEVTWYLQCRRTTNRQMSSARKSRDFICATNSVVRGPSAQRRFTKKNPYAPVIAWTDVLDLSDRVGGCVVVRHAHVIVDGGTESSETSATESSGLWASFGSESTACDAASCHAVVQVVLRAELCGFTQ